MFKKILFLGLVIFSNVKPAEDHPHDFNFFSVSAEETYESARYSISLGNYQSGIETLEGLINNPSRNPHIPYKNQYLRDGDKCRARLILARIYAGLDNKYQGFANYNKALHYLHGITNPNSGAAIEERTSALQIIRFVRQMQREGI